jgi:phenylpropionate dioxygenase-like ring-hydroxylating dioxygenase large terminal subunit
VAQRSLSIFRYARGWFGVAASHELTARGVRPLRYFGRDLVLFRGVDGIARVLDGHCPHLGAHLGMGGTVEGNAIRCPFHGWTWDGAGACTSIHYAKKIPTHARTRAWPVQEKNGMILVYHDDDDRPPRYEVPDVFVEHGGLSAWRVVSSRRWRIENCPAYDVLENAADSAHFARVHGTSDTTTTLEIDGDCARTRSVTSVRLLGRWSVETELDTAHFGPGFARVLLRRFPLMVTSSTLPVDERATDSHVVFWVRRTLNPAPWLLGRWLLAPEACRQFEEDIPIWLNKRHWDRPVLCDGDGPIMKFRRWYRRYLNEEAEGSRREPDDADIDALACEPTRG